MPDTRWRRDARAAISSLLVSALAAGLALPPPLLADPPGVNRDPTQLTVRPVPPAPRTPESVFGNYAGAGKCPADAPKPCRDSGAFDNVFLERSEKPETEREAHLRHVIGQEKTDTRVVIRIARDHGQSCAFGGEMYWAGDHLEFQDRPPYGAKICKLQLWFENDGVVIKDSGEVCGWKFCSAKKPTTLTGRRFKKGPDPLLVAYKKSPTPPPATIFGTYRGTGRCATDERKPKYCRDNKDDDYIIVKPGETGDARVVVGSLKRPGEDRDYFCLNEVDAMWLGNHLAFVGERPDKPEIPIWVQFWFKDDTVVMRGINPLLVDGGDLFDHCGSYYNGTLFKKPPAPPARDTQR